MMDLTQPQIEAGAKAFNAHHRDTFASEAAVAIYTAMTAAAPPAALPEEAVELVGWFRDLATGNTMVMADTLEQKADQLAALLTRLSAEREEAVDLLGNMIALIEAADVLANREEYRQVCEARALLGKGAE